MKKRNVRLVVLIVCVLTILFAAVPTAMAAGATMSLGSRGDNVTALQNKLLTLGYLDTQAQPGIMGH